MHEKRNEQSSTLHSQRDKIVAKVQYDSWLVSVVARNRICDSQGYPQTFRAPINRIVQDSMTGYVKPLVLCLALVLYTGC
jgi:hypothetical protein